MTFLIRLCISLVLLMCESVIATASVSELSLFDFATGTAMVTASNPVGITKQQQQLSTEAESADGAVSRETQSYVASFVTMVFSSNSASQCSNSVIEGGFSLQVGQCFGLQAAGVRPQSFRIDTDLNNIFINYFTNNLFCAPANFTKVEVAAVGCNACASVSAGSTFQSSTVTCDGYLQASIGSSVASTWGPPGTAGLIHSIWDNYNDCSAQVTGVGYIGQRFVPTSSVGCLSLTGTTSAIVSCATTAGVITYNPVYTTSPSCTGATGTPYTTPTSDCGADEYSYFAASRVNCYGSLVASPTHGPTLQPSGAISASSNDDDDDDDGTTTSQSTITALAVVFVLSLLAVVILSILLYQKGGCDSCIGNKTEFNSASHAIRDFPTATAASAPPANSMNPIMATQIRQPLNESKI